MFKSENILFVVSTTDLMPDTAVFIELAVLSKTDAEAFKGSITLLCKLDAKVDALRLTLPNALDS
jgi:hypothetical protein